MTTIPSLFKRVRSNNSTLAISHKNAIKLVKLVGLSEFP